MRVLAVVQGCSYPAEPALMSETPPRLLVIALSERSSPAVFFKESCPACWFVGGARDRRHDSTLIS